MRGVRRGTAGRRSAGAFAVEEFWVAKGGERAKVGECPYYLR